MTQIDGMDIAVKIVLGSLGFALVALFKRVSDDIKTMSKSVEKLNINMAVALTKIGGHTDQLSEHSNRLTRLEARSRAKEKV